MADFLDFWVHFFGNFVDTVSSLTFDDVNVFVLIVAVLVVSLLISYIFKDRG